ncbi:unnamed protein product [Didymodactylos carnosus]|uniref:Uncharacterized protein n=1 Tax=Didymodactylos carnosus TaxID=1234261 RepID=A0A813XC53_9BILA|nr:unnamed protein product [Didymodactylos carnosus]CAF0909545.1 unnamed protein product [Didymodactylos carnosus]CAF3650755.1 unnamed protein product [Didymodactylos carnosus]CAF3688812.1 unnamed protein product [Didymodactylos carnosus]
MTTLVLKNRNGYLLFPKPESPSFIHRSRSPKLPTIPKCRRLESRTISQSSNYYVTYPRQSSPPLIIKPHHKLDYPYQFKRYYNTSEYCDLFNLLESDIELKLLKNTTSPSDYWQQYYTPRRIKRRTRRQQTQCQHQSITRKHSHHRKRHSGNRRRSVDFEYAHVRLNRDKFVHENHCVLLADCCTVSGVDEIEHQALLSTKKSKIKTNSADRKTTKKQSRQNNFWRLALNYFCIPIGTP